MMDAEFVVFKYRLREVIEISHADQAVRLRRSFPCASIRRNAEISVLDIKEKEPATTPATIATTPMPYGQTLHIPRNDSDIVL